MSLETSPSTRDGAEAATSRRQAGAFALSRPLDVQEKGALGRMLSGLLAFQRRLGRFPAGTQAPEATPIVSLYARGELRGCSASTEGPPGERVRRAFLLALGDPRFGGLDPADRDELVAALVYPIGLRRVSLDAAPRVIAPGAHGLALANGNGFPTLLVPAVAREHELDAEGLLAAMEQKAALDRHAWPPNGLFLFETDGVVARGGSVSRARSTPVDPREAAVRWLAARVATDGAVHFGVDPRSGHDEVTGEMLHGRAAVVIRALAAHPAGAAARRRALRWLEDVIAQALRGRAVEGWPTGTAEIAGTVALARLAGVAVDTPLRELARSDALRSSPWHAGQVACALGEATPAPLWRACVRDVEREPRAPWTALASARRAAWPVFERAATALAAQVREHGPHRGGVGAPAPELALTAITAEALAPANIEPLIRARRLAQDFLACRQVIGDTLPESSAPARLHGGFPLTPVHAFQRSDVTAHAVLAMWADAPHASSRQELRHALGVPFDGRR